MMRNQLSFKSLGFVLLLAGIQMSPAFAEVNFLGDWTDFGSQIQFGSPTRLLPDGTPVEWTAGSGPNHWISVQELGQDRLTSMLDKTSPKRGAVLRVEVQSGDSCGYTGERAEVSHMLSPTGTPYHVTKADGHEFYAISVKLDPGWEAPTPNLPVNGRWQWGIFLQIHSPDAFNSPPAFALAAEDTFHVSMLGGDLLGPDGLRRNATSMVFTNGGGDLRPGHWVQFLVDVLWSYESTGTLTVYRKDEGQQVFTQVLAVVGVPTLQFDSEFPNSQNTDPTLNAGTTYLHYWKTGFYRSISPGMTSRLWLGPVVRGTSLQQVALAAFQPSVTPNPPTGVAFASP